MASGDTIFKFVPASGTPDDDAPAYLDEIIADTGLRTVIVYGTSADQKMTFADIWPSHYDGGGIDVKIMYSTDGTDQGEIEWNIAAEVLQDDDDSDAGGQDFGAVTDITDIPAAATDNKTNITAPGTISHVNCGSPSPGDGFRLDVTRDIDHDTSANTDNLQIHKIYVTET